MRIVEIEDFFHPNTGYQVNVLSKYFARFGHDVTIVCGEMDKMPKYLTDFFDVKNIDNDDKMFFESTGVNIIRVPIFKYISGRAVYSKKIFKIVDELHPDILFIHSEDTLIAMQFLLRMHKKNYALIMDNHQCDISSHNKFREVFRWIYRKIFTPIIIKNKYKVVRLVENDYYMLNHFNIPIELTPCITFGTDTLLFHPDLDLKIKFRKKYSIPKDAFVVVYAGKLDQYKGGLFLANAIKLKLNAVKEIVFVIVGNTSGEYGEEVENIFSESENRVIRFPTQNYNDLAKFFQFADIAIFPKECSLTFYDAQACGLPVLSEDNEINVNRCSNGNGLNFKQGNIGDFRDKIIEFANIDKNSFNKMSKLAEKYVIDNYNYEDKARSFEKLMIEEVERQKKSLNLKF